jgi:hypothetical protein
MHLDEEKLETLRRWGQGLRETRDEGSAAAGRAILLLIEEVERSRLELLRTRKLTRAVPLSSDEATGPEEETIESTLHGGLRRAHGQEPDSPAGTRPAAVEEAGSSPESWIEALRRQK